MKLINGNSEEELKKLQENSIDTIITDPPYGLSFMGKKWDYDVPSIALWKEVLRVLKPGGTLLCFAGSRTQHRMACNVEDAGFILKDCIMWLYGSGFPKATDISKQLDKGHERKIVGTKITGNARTDDGWNGGQKEVDITAPSTPEVILWNGWKSHGLKPAYEPILVAIKPNEGTYAQNALKHGVAGLNIDGGRIESDTLPKERPVKPEHKTYKEASLTGFLGQSEKPKKEYKGGQGRFPANIILDEEAGRLLDLQSGDMNSTGRKAKKHSEKIGMYGGGDKTNNNYLDKGGASRFFYCAKASKKERNAGCEGLEEKRQWASEKRESNSFDIFQNGKPPMVSRNNHPTVKPLALMEYLCTLTKTPTGGIVLDPFMGSGTTGVAAKRTGRDFIGIELNKEYMKIAEARINNVNNKKIKEIKVKIKNKSNIKPNGLDKWL